MSRQRLRVWWCSALAGAIALLAALAWATTTSARAPVPLAAMLPAGALMTVESPDFGALVAAWNSSPEQRAWLASANYSAFSNSRLSSRLADAQRGFADAAKGSIDGDFLKQVAGKESIFAWYNIGNLEFLYLSRLPQDRLARLSLMAQRGSFAQREVAGTAFYIRTASGSAASASQDPSAASDPPQTGGSGIPDQPRSVAFAVRGDWLLLATREDLLAGALQLMAASQGTKATAGSQATAGWYAAANAASTAQHGDLHMLLDLQSLTRTPQFRTYWIQRNVTEMRQYRAAVVDLYREPTQFREERVLLPMQPDTAEVEQPDLGALEHLVPERPGVYRAVARPDTVQVLGAMREKVLVREPTTAPATMASPAAQTEVLPAGAAGDFASRIDAPAPKPEAAVDTFEDLRHVLAGAGVESMLTIDRTDPPNSQDSSIPFVHVRSAVVLRSASPWNMDALAAALLAGLRPRLTTSALGVGWTEGRAAGGSFRTLGAASPLCLAVQGSMAIVTTDPAMMEDILKRSSTPSPAATRARQLAGFRHDEERANFRRLERALNLLPTSPASVSPPGPSGPTEAAPIDLFRDNLPSLSDTFAALASEHFTETSDGAKVHQTVLYRWDNPAPSR